MSNRILYPGNCSRYASLLTLSLTAHDDTLDQEEDADHDGNCDVCPPCFVKSELRDYVLDRAQREYAEECEKRLRKKFLGEDAGEKDFKTKWLEFRQALRKKYKGKDVIRPVN